MPTLAQLEHDFWAQVWRCTHRLPCKRCCWPWKAALDLGKRTAHGYGAFAFPGMAHPIPAHRVALILSKGALFLPLATGKDRKALAGCHRCDFPPCCNPAHLFLGTRGDNTKDAQRKGFFAMDRHKPVRLPDGSVLHRETCLPDQRSPEWGAYLRRMRAR